MVYRNTEDTLHYNNHFVPFKKFIFDRKLDSKFQIAKIPIMHIYQLVKINILY